MKTDFELATQRKCSYDPTCETLARYFLSDYGFTDKAMAVLLPLLSQEIQEAIEGWLDWDLEIIKTEWGKP